MIVIALCVMIIYKYTFVVPTPTKSMRLSVNCQRLLCTFIALVDNRARPLGAADFGGSTERKSDTRIAKERSRGARVHASVKVDIRTILVGARKPVLSAERVALGRTEVGDLDDDGIASVGESIARAVCLGGQFPACATGWTSAGSWTDTKFVLGYCGGVAGARVEATGGRGGVAVARAKGVASSVLGKGGLEGGASADRSCCRARRCNSGHSGRGWFD